MKTLFIVNPIAGKGKAKSLIPLIEEECKSNGLDYLIKYTTEPKDGTRIARAGVEEGYKKIISVGGDGTLNEVVNGIVGSDVILGVIPSGTGNDFIRSIYKEFDMVKIINNVINGAVKTIDLAKCNDTYFLNIGSGGIDAQVALESERTRKFFSGSTAYIVAMIKTIFLYKSKMMKVYIDDKEFDKNTLLVAIANGRYYGGGILPAPKASLTDGIFDVCFIEKISKPKMLILFPKYMKGKHESIKEVSFYRGKKIRLIATEEFGVNIDGEVSLKKDVEFNIIPNGIKIVAADNV
jgi:diacylglycerol kinase (ATP)